MKQSELKKILFLLNDVDRLLLKVLQNKFYKDAGWESIIVTSYDDALNEIYNKHPDVLITEIILDDPQGRSGFQLIKTIKGQKKDRKLKIMIFTDLRLDEDKQRARDLGVEHYFVKSQITINQLMSEIKKAVS